MVIVAGVTTSDVGAGGPTVMVVFPTVMPSQLVAVMVVVPSPVAVAIPVVSIVATLVFVLPQVTWLETSRLPEPPAANVNPPIAMKDWLPPSGTLGAAGFSVIELS